MIQTTIYKLFIVTRFWKPLKAINENQQICSIRTNIQLIGNPVSLKGLDSTDQCIIRIKKDSGSKAHRFSCKVLGQFVDSFSVVKPTM